MATDEWAPSTSLSGNWDTPTYWTLGRVPGPRDHVATFGKELEVTASFGTVASLEVVDTLVFVDAGASSVTSGRGDHRVIVDENLLLDPYSGNGGSSLTVGGYLIDYQADGTVQIGPPDGTLSAASTIRTNTQRKYRFGLLGGGHINLYGSSTAQATLDVGGGAGFWAAGVLTGEVNLSGDALLEFGFGQITTIAANSALSLIGSHAFVAKASDTSSNSALKGLDTVTGALDLSNGAAVTTSGALSDGGAINMDGAADDGGSLLNIKGALTNSGTIQIGNDSLSARSRLEAASVVNDGAINLDGHAAAYAILHVAGAFANGGSVNLSDDVDRIAGPVSGTGDFSLSNGSTLKFGSSVSSGETVNCDSTPDKLVLDSPSSFNGTIDDFFTRGDAVLASGFDESATTFLYTQTGADSCSWTLTEATHTAVLNFAGEPYAQGDFSIVAAKGAGYSVIKFV